METNFSYQEWVVHWMKQVDSHLAISCWVQLLKDSLFRSMGSARLVFFFLEEIRKWVKILLEPGVKLASEQSSQLHSSLEKGGDMFLFQRYILCLCEEVEGRLRSLETHSFSFSLMWTVVC